MNMYVLIKPIGIATYCSMILAVALIMIKMKFHIKWINMKWHTYCGILAVILGTIHAVIIWIVSR
jgi:hypothetical protein